MRYKITKLFCVLFSFMLAFSAAFTVQAKSTSELRKEKQAIEKEISQSEEKLKDLRAEKSETKEYMSTLQGKISLMQDKLDTLENQRSALQKEINAIQEKIEKTTAEIETSQREIEAKQAEFNEVYEQYCQRLRAMYISGNVSTLEVLLESGDMSSILTRAEMVKCVATRDNATLDELMQKMQEIEKQKHELELKKLELKEDKANLDSQKAELQSSINEISAAKKELDAEIAECNALIRKLSNTESEIMETIESNKEEIQAIENEIYRASQSSTQPSGSYTPGSGSLGYPTSYRTISAGYPNYKSGAYHGGIDFQCPSGTPVYAADSGYVAIAKSLTYSYGKYILINHGNGISTLYAHNSSLAVTPGQAVSKGQLIAYSGSTGNSTGPHCHFEVRVNGTRVNPLSYLG